VLMLLLRAQKCEKSQGTAPNQWPVFLYEKP